MPCRTVEPQYGNGKFDVAMYLYESNAFTTPVETFPVKVDIGAVVYVGVVLTSLDTDLKLVVPRCYATPDAEGEAEVLHYFIQDKYADTMMLKCWASVGDGGPTFEEHWMDFNFIVVLFPQKGQVYKV